MCGELEGTGFRSEDTRSFDARGGYCLRCLWQSLLTRVYLAEAAGLLVGGWSQTAKWSGRTASLASAAVGIFVQLLCPWRNRTLLGLLREYDGRVTYAFDQQQVALPRKETSCRHFPRLGTLGDPFWKNHECFPRGSPKVGARLAMVCWMGRKVVMCDYELRPWGLDRLFGRRSRGAEGNPERKSRDRAGFGRVLTGSPAHRREKWRRRNRRSRVQL